MSTGKKKNTVAINFNQEIPKGYNPIPEFQYDEKTEGEKTKRLAGTKSDYIHFFTKMSFALEWLGVLPKKRVPFHFLFKKSSSESHAEIHCIKEDGDWLHIGAMVITDVKSLDVVYMTEQKKIAREKNPDKFTHVPPRFVVSTKPLFTIKKGIAEDYFNGQPTPVGKAFIMNDICRKFLTDVLIPAEYIVSDRIVVHETPKIKMGNIEIPYTELFKN